MVSTTIMAVDTVVPPVLYCRYTYLPTRTRVIFVLNINYYYFFFSIFFTARISLSVALNIFCLIHHCAARYYTLADTPRRLLAGEYRFSGVIKRRTIPNVFKNTEVTSAYFPLPVPCNATVLVVTITND